jgi:hypothetical protein
MDRKNMKITLGRMKVVALLALCAVSIAGVGMWQKYKAPEKLPSRREENVEARPVLATVAVSRSVRQSLLTKDFVLVNQFRGLSDGCEAGFLSSFSPKLSSADVADPGEPFQDSDALIAGLPFRRLVFAGEQPGKCFVYYQYGGKMYAEFCVAVIDEQSKKPLWVARRSGSRPAQSIDELRAQILSDALRDDLGSVC